MDFSKIIGELVQQGVSGRSRSRLDKILGTLQADGADGKLEQLVKNMVGSTASNTSSSRSGWMKLISSFLGNKQVGNVSGRELTGIGALAGALLSGDAKARKGALGGGAMAVLGSLALNALKGYMATTNGAQANATQFDQQAVDAVNSSDTQRLIVSAMITAAKADGVIDEQEKARILGKLSEGGLTDEERQWLIEELQRPVDIAALVAQVSNQVIAAEVYSASLLAIDIDTEEERSYLRSLAQQLELNAEVIKRLHLLTGAPQVG